MANISALQQAVANAENYLLLVEQNVPNVRSGSFTGADTVIAQFAEQRRKDAAAGNITLQNAKDALAAALQEVQDNVNVIPINPIISSTEPNSTISKQNNIPLIIIGSIAALILLK